MYPTRHPAQALSYGRSSPVPFSRERSRLIFFGEDSLRRAVSEYLDHYHGERNHQSLDNSIIRPGEEVGRTAGDVACRERLGGLLRYHYRHAA